MSKSLLERSLSTQMRYHGLPQPEREYAFIPNRRYRADFAFPEARILIDVEGGLYITGRHSRGQQYENDLWRSNLAQLDGWLHLRFGPNQIKSGEAARMVADALALRAAS